MNTASEILDSFGGNISRAARATGISRATWHQWKRTGFPKALNPRLELWLLKNSLPSASHLSGGLPPPQ